MAPVGRRPGQVEVGGRQGPRLKAMAGSIGQVRQLCSLKRAKHFRLRFSGSCLRIPSRQVLAVACELRADTTASCILARIDNRPDSLYYRN